MPDAAHESHEVETPPTGKRHRRAGLGAIVAASILAAGLLGALAALWLSGEQVFGLLAGKEAVDAEKIAVDAEAFKSYFKVERKAAGTDGRSLVLTLRRTRAFPQSEADLEPLAERADKTFPALRVLQAVGDGYVRCEYLAKKGKFLGHTFERVKGLAASEEMELALPVGNYQGVEKIVLTY